MTSRRLDLIICTYNRSYRLEPLLKNVMTTPVPPGWERRVYLVNNNSSDDTAEVAERLVEAYGSALSYVFEEKQGLSNARNAGIAAGDGELVGFVDDDELLDENWFFEAIQPFEDRQAIGYISGTYEPDYAAPPPDWLPLKTFPAVIGVIRLGNRNRDYGPDFDEVMMGGNCVIRRTALDDVGGFNSKLGRSGSGTQTGEDREMQQRLEEAGYRGQYRPRLVIFHHIPEARMKRSYFIRWAYSDAIFTTRSDRVIQGRLSRFGLPAWQWRRAGQGLLTYVFGGLFGADPARRFEGLLNAVLLAGALVGLMTWSKAKQD